MVMIAKEQPGALGVTLNGVRADSGSVIQGSNTAPHVTSDMFSACKGETKVKANQSVYIYIYIYSYAVKCNKKCLRTFGQS